MIPFKDKVIPLAAIHISPVHWQREIKDEDIDEIGNSIAKFGQLHQLIVRQVKGKISGVYELLSGRVRYLSMKAEGIREARCAVVDVDDRVAEIISIIENLHRRSPKESELRWGVKRYGELLEADATKKAADEAERHKQSGTKPRPGRPTSPKTVAAKQVAEDLGISPDKAREVLKRAANLCPSATRALDRGLITVDQANRLSRMSRPKQQEELRLMLEETQVESRERLKGKSSKSPTKVVLNNLKNIIAASKALQSKSDELANYIDKQPLDWDVVRQIKMDPLRGAANSLLDLAGLIETS